MNLPTFKKLTTAEIGIMNEQSLASTLSTGLDYESRTIYLFGEINGDSAYRFITAINQLDREDEAIRVVMSSGGGSVHEGYAIYDAIKMSENLVVVDCMGSCMSMAALILQAADIRRMTPEARFMVHNGHVEFGQAMATETMASMGAEMSLGNNRYAQILSSRSGLSLAQVKKMCSAETYLSAQETVEMGFADFVLNYEDKSINPLQPKKKSVKKAPARKKK
jgi:ATP-dependent Clp protease, protease subunit